MPSNMELYLEKILKRTNPEKYIEILEQDREDFAKEIIELQAKINRAIKFIEENANYDISIKQCRDNLFDCECDDLLTILGDKENE